MNRRQPEHIRPPEPASESESHTADGILDALDKFFIMPSLANMVAVLQALQTHRATILAMHQSRRSGLIARVLRSRNNENHLAA